MTRITRAEVEAIMHGQVPAEDEAEIEPDPFDARLAELEAKFTEPAQRAEMLRLKVAKKFGIDPRLASRLTGDDEAEVEADAQEMLAAFPSPPRRRPTEQLRGGLGVDAPAELDPRALAALVRRAPWE